MDDMAETNQGFNQLEAAIEMNSNLSAEEKQTQKGKVQKMREGCFAMLSLAEDFSSEVWKSSGGPTFAQKVKDFVRRVLGWIKETCAKIKDAVVQMASKVKDALKRLYERFTSAFHDVTTHFTFHFAPPAFTVSFTAKGSS